MMPNRQEGERIMGNVFVVGIAGGSASGKTTIADQIQQYFGDQIEVIRHDSYYLPHNDMTYEERTRIVTAADGTKDAESYTAAIPMKDVTEVYGMIESALRLRISE